MKLQCLKPRLGTVPGRLQLAAAQQTKRLRGTTWMNIRDRILRRDCGMCQPCKERGEITAASQVDHKVPLFKGGSNDDDNLQSICEPCHTAKTAREATERSTSAIV